MKLAEIKSFLIEQFFTDDSLGITPEELSSRFESLSKLLTRQLGSFLNESLRRQDGNSNDPSKAFKRFTEGSSSILTIFEEDGSQKLAIFGAIRAGKQVVYTDFTHKTIDEKQGDLAAVKQAIRQAKNINDDVIYHIVSKE